MKLRVSCFECAQAYIAPFRDKITGELPPDKAIIPDNCMIEFDVTDAIVYDLTCRRGHKSYYVYPDEKFELLLDSGLNAFYDSYFREAVTSVIASVERLYEFALKVMSHSQQVSDVNFAKAWKSVANQSERQLGAFTFTWLAINNEIPPLLSNDATTFRNKVVHKGHFPKREETYKFISESLIIIHEVIKGLKSKFPSSLESIYKQEPQSQMDKYSRSGVLTQGSITSSIVNIILGGHTPNTLDKMLENIGLSRESLRQLKAREEI